MTRPSFVAAALACVVGCKAGDAPPPTAGSAQAATTSAPAPPAAPASTAAASAALVSRAPAFKQVSRLGKDAILFDVGKELVGCEDGCRVPDDPAAPMPKVSAIDAAGAHDEPSLSIEGAHGVSRKELYLLKNLHVVYFEGPSGAMFAAYRHDGQGGGDGPSRWDLSLRRAGSKWVVSGTESEPVVWPREPGPDLDEALAHAPWKLFGERAIGGYLHSVVFGSGGPPVEVHEADLARWDGKAWAKSAAPWKAPSDIERLANGTTLVLADGGAWLWADGEPQPIALDGHTPDRKLELHTVDGARWLASRGPDDLRVYAPRDPATMKRGPLDPPKGPYDPPSRTGDLMPAATGASPGCATPFVIIASSHERQVYGYTLGALRGHPELQDELTFVEFERDGAVVFGAQAKTADVADKLVAILKEKVKGMKPILGCLDARAHLDGPGRAALTQRHVLNLATGEFIAKR